MNEHVYIVLQNGRSPGSLCRGVFTKMEDAILKGEEWARVAGLKKNSSTPWYAHWNEINEEGVILQEILVLEKHLYTEYTEGVWYS